MIKHSHARALFVLALLVAPVVGSTSVADGAVVSKKKPTKLKLTKSGLQIRCQNINGTYYETGTIAGCAGVKSDIVCDYSATAPTKNCTRTPVRVKPPRDVVDTLVQGIIELSNEANTNAGASCPAPSAPEPPATESPTTTTTVPPTTTSTAG
jgi:hypothetical protein